jgi:3'(2'), 5'-bisphosphate nucleotidase
MLFYQEQYFIDNFVELIKKCNKVILDIYNDKFDIIYKDDNSPLTIADKTCNNIICNYLNHLNCIIDERISIVSEENKNESYDIRKSYEYVWLVDPLDGTKEFVKKNGEFTVNIGLAYNGIPVFGIVSIPVTGEIYIGIKDVGSYKIYNNEKKLLKINKKDYKSKNLNIVASKSHINEATKEFISQFDKPNIKNTGSSIKLLWIAENKADIYPRIALTSEWDTCAAHAVVKYAGGRVIVYEKNKYFYNSINEVKYNKKNILNPFFVCF